MNTEQQSENLPEFTLAAVTFIVTTCLRPSVKVGEVYMHVKLSSIVKSQKAY